MAGISKHAEELVKVLKEDNISKIRQLVKGGFNVNSRDSMRRTVLHYAAFISSLNMIKQLVGLGADINVRDLKQVTPLHYAMVRTTNLNDLAEKKKLINCLLNLGSDINARYHDSAPSIHRAIRSGHIQAVKVLASLGLENETDSVGFTAFYMAVKEGDKEMMKYLVQKGADVNAESDFVSTLHIAVQSGNIEMVQTLLEHGADIKIGQRSMSKVTPVTYTAMLEENKLGRNNGHYPSEPITQVTTAAQGKNKLDLGVFTCLSHLGANFNTVITLQSAVFDAIALDRLDLLNCLIRYGADINSVICLETPLVIELRENEPDVDFLEQLIRCGADVNAKCDTPFTSTVKEASLKGNVEMVKALVSHGADLNKRLLKGVTALFALLAINDPTDKDFNHEPSKISQKHKLTKAFIRLGADVNVKSDTVTLINAAVECSDVNMVKTLCDLGADVNDRIYKGLSLIVKAEWMFDEERIGADIIEILMEAGADPNIGYDSETALCTALKCSTPEMVKTLTELGADMDVFIDRGLKPIHLACQLDTASVLEILLQHGANPNDHYTWGLKPLLETLLGGNTEMVQCLIQCGANKQIELGETYGRQNLLYQAATQGNGEILNCLIKAGAKDLLGCLPPIDEETLRLAKNFQIDIVTAPRLTLLAQYIMNDGNVDIVEMWLPFASNQAAPVEGMMRPSENEKLGYYSDPEVPHSFEIVSSRSPLHAACFRGNLNVVRLLIIEGGNVNEYWDGSLPFDFLPLAKCINYSTLEETRTAAKVIEKVGFNFDPFVPRTDMESLVSYPGLGDVQSIQNPNVNELTTEIHNLVQMILKGSKLLSKVHLRNCGSAAEGTKVGLPDEMDFLVQVTQLDSTKQFDLKSAGHDYVHYFDQMDKTLEDGSKTFHTHFSNELFRALRGTKLPEGFNCQQLGQDSSIRDSKRKATSPIHFIKDNWYQNSKFHVHVCISVDVVPCVHIKDWPATAVSKTWLLDKKQLREHGYYLVPKPPHASSNLAKEYTHRDLQDMWKISFPHLETYHMQHLEKRVKDVYMLAKCLRNPDVSRIMVTDEGSYPRNMDKYVTSYMLKMIFFKNVEEFLRTDLSLGEMVCRVYDGVEAGLSQGFIPLYFMPMVNALGGHKLDVPKCARVARILQRFAHKYYQRDLRGTDGEEEVTKPLSVYTSIEIGYAEEEFT